MKFVYAFCTNDMMKYYMGNGWTLGIQCVNALAIHANYFLEPSLPFDCVDTTYFHGLIWATRSNSIAS